MATPKNYLIAISETDGPLSTGWAHHLEPVTIPEAERMIAWQRRGGFNTEFTLASPEPSLPGVFTNAADPDRPILVTRGPYTREAFGRFLVSIWGDLV